MPTGTALDTTAKRLPTWVLSLLSIAIVSYVFALTAVAIFTERNVEFLPPKIGPGPKQAIAEELKLVRSEIRQLNTDFLGRIRKIDENLAVARTRAAESREDKSVSVYLKWDEVVSEYQKDKASVKDIYISRVNSIDKKIDEIERKIEQHLML